MKVAKLNEAIENLKENAGTGLIGMDLWGKNDGIPIAGFNQNYQAAALFNRIYSQLLVSLKGANFPTGLSHYSLFLDDSKLVISGAVADTDFMYGMLIDTKQVQLGLVLSVLLPSFVKEVETAIKS